MSKRINVNPDHYKTEGRDRPNRAAEERQSRATKAAASPSAPRRDSRQSGKALLADRRGKSAKKK